MQKTDMVFNSEKDTAGVFHQIASGYISTTSVLFEKEGVVAVIQAKGSVEFFNADGALIASGNVPAAEGGRELYEDVAFGVENGLIKLTFPIYQWIDNYPHCDGEHDRWDKKTVGSHSLSLNLLTGEIVY